MTLFDPHLSPWGNEAIKLVVSVIAGCVLGLEREVRGKTAGFRTIALISLGATAFTICSYILGVTDNRDRLAANIITGVGFIGGGVIFRTNSTISGITTAASVWVAAAMGMLIGINQFMLAGICLLSGLFILYMLDFLQFWIDKRFEHRSYRITCASADEHERARSKAKEFGLEIMNNKLSRNNTVYILDLTLTGRQKSLELFNNWLVQQSTVISFEW